MTIRKADGQTVQIKRSEAGIIQLFNEAMKGGSRARTDLNNLIKDLYIAGMLSSTTRPPRLKPPSPEAKVLTAAKNVIMTHFVKRFLLSRFDASFGSVPPFTTRHEQTISDIDDVPGLAPLLEQNEKLRVTLDRVKLLIQSEALTAVAKPESVFEDAEQQLGDVENGPSSKHPLGYEAAAEQSVEDREHDDESTSCNPKPYPTKLRRSKMEADSIRRCRAFRAMANG